jgi:orotate phosphoribosyltransferase-like protein
MEKTILNHEFIRKLIRSRGITISDLARKMKVSRQMAHYIVYRGGPKYSYDLSRALSCRPEDLLTSWNALRLPEGFGLVDNRVRVGEVQEALDK